VVAKRRLIVLLVAVLVVSISSSRLSSSSLSSSSLRVQSNSSVLAIVGARIVDGSGNEPFDGTIVVRDGRIAEVGRTVRPPEGARIVEAHGRTVTPGLIDVRVNLPANANAADASVARVMAAYLHAGVTTIGVADLDEGQVDTLRDRLEIARIRAPRLVAATAPPNAMLASTLGNTVPDATALADWKKRNATFVPELLLTGASDRRVALDRLRAAQQAGVRIAVGSNTGATDLAPGISTLRELRMLEEGGLTPLQALTAVTSGSAWALGLQSDRAFLAVGQRGDLAILSSDLKGSGALSRALSGDGELVEQVFIGGEEIDRAALKAILTPPETTAPESTSAANAGGAAHAAGAEGASGAAPVKSAAKSAKAAVGRAGRKGRGRASDAAEATTTVAAGAGRAAAPGPPADSAAPATPNGTTTPAPTPNATAPASASGAPSTTGATSATGAPSTTGAPSAAGASATRAAGRPATAPVPMTTTSAPAGVAASGAAAASGAGAAPGAAAASAPIPLAEPLIDDFESGGDQTGLGPIWNASNDSGSTTDVIVGRVVRGLRDHALHLTARMGDTAEPYVRVAVSMVHDGHPADVSQFHGLRFEARGQGRYRVVFVTRSVTDGRYHESFFSGSPLWTPVSIPFGTLGQASGGQRVKWTGSDLLEIAFQVARDPGQIGWLELDNLRFY
jgi:imidazolonepropionase-like amidohydrolase